MSAPQAKPLRLSLPNDTELSNPKSCTLTAFYENDAFWQVEGIPVHSDIVYTPTYAGIDSAAAALDAMRGIAANPRPPPKGRRPRQAGDSTSVLAERTGLTEINIAFDGLTITWGSRLLTLAFTENPVSAPDAEHKWKVWLRLPIGEEKLLDEAERVQLETLRTVWSDQCGAMVTLPATDAQQEVESLFGALRDSVTTVRGVLNGTITATGGQHSQ